MRKAKNISIKKAWNSLLWILAMLTIAVLMWFAINTQLDRNLEAIQLNIEKLEGTRNLVSKKVILQSIEDFIGGPIEEIAFKNIDIKSLEKALTKDSRVENAEVYVDGQNMLHVEILQRVPIVRVMSETGEDYYLDRMGSRIRTVKNSAVRVPIVTGNISKYNNEWRSIKSHELHNIVGLANELRKDDFLKALVEQIHIDQKGSITLIPKVGHQKLILGSSNELKEKLQNLKATYKTLVRLKGFEKYDQFNFEITNQVAARDPKKAVS